MMMSRLQLMQAINAAEAAQLKEFEGEELSFQGGIGAMADALRVTFFGEFSEMMFIGEHGLLTTSATYWIVYVEPEGYTVIANNDIPLTIAREFFAPIKTV